MAHSSFEVYLLCAAHSSFALSLLCLSLSFCGFATQWGQAWDQEHTVQSVMHAAPAGGTRTKVARLSHEKVATTSEACSTPKTGADTYIKALMLIDTLLEHRTFSPKQAHTMRWMCLWRQTPVSLLHEAYGTNPELFAIRCKSFSLLYVHPPCICPVGN